MKPGRHPVEEGRSVGVPRKRHGFKLLVVRKPGHGKPLSKMSLPFPQHVDGKPGARLHDRIHPGVTPYVEAHEGRVERDARKGADGNAPGFCLTFRRNDHNGRGDPAHRSTKYATLHGLGHKKDD